MAQTPEKQGTCCTHTFEQVDLLPAITALVEATAGMIRLTTPMVSRDVTWLPYMHTAHLG